jgi:hypothetical protein
MRGFSMFATCAALAFVTCAALAFVACAGSATTGTNGGSSNGSPGAEGGSSSQCDDLAMQICQKTAACSTGHDGGVSVFLVSGADEAGVNGSPFTVNGDVSHCNNFLHLTCLSSEHAPAFVANCGPVVNGLQCGTDPTYGNGIVIPVACGQNL